MFSATLKPFFGQWRSPNEKNALQHGFILATFPPTKLKWDLVNIYIIFNVNSESKSGAYDLQCTTQSVFYDFRVP